jgi:hypothetical protein
VQVGADALVAAFVAEGQDLLPEFPGVGATLVPAVVQVGFVVVENGGPVLPLAGEEVLRFRGVGELFGGPPGHPELSLDRALAVACLQQGVHGCVPGPGPVGEPVPAWPWRLGLARGWHCHRLGLR